MPSSILKKKRPNGPQTNSRPNSVSFIEVPKIRLLMLTNIIEGNGRHEKGTLNIIGVGCDVSSEVSVQKAFKLATDEFGRIDSVVASAGAFGRKLAF